MRKRFVVTMYFSYVSHSGGVIDVARNLLDGFGRRVPGQYSVLYPSESVRAPKARTLLRFLSDLWVGVRYYFSDIVVLFPNYFCIPLPFARLKSVVVVHDLMFKHFPENVNPIKRVFLNITYYIVKFCASGVVFISKYSQEDFIRIYGNPRRCEYIYNPVVLKGGGADVVRTEGPVAVPYVIANFHYYPHKNIEGLLDIFGQLHASWPELHLVFTGNKPSQYDTLVANHPAKASICHLGFLPKEQVMALIRDAAFFMSLSTFEGFNMSAAEAGLLGKALVLSDIPVHRELFSECARFVDLRAEAIDVDGILEFVRSYEPVTPWYAAHVEPEEVAARYVAFMDEVAAGR